MKHRCTDGLSELGKHIIESCEHAYVLNGQVFDQCHLYWSENQSPDSWDAYSDVLIRRE